MNKFIGMSQEEKNNSLLLAAGQSGGGNDIGMLLQEGAEINTKDQAGATPLIKAVMHDNIDNCRRLIECGADVNMADDNGDTALIYAASGGRSDICKALLNAGARASIDMENKQGNNALSLAAPVPYVETCLALIEAGANRALAGVSGDTALKWAAWAQRRDIAIDLLRSGEKTNSDKNGGLSLLVARWREELAIGVRKVFPAGMLPTTEKCFADGKISVAVIDACVTDQFDSLVSTPLIAAKQYALFEKVWGALPEYWRDQNQGIYIGYVKREKEVTPAIHSSEEGRVV